MPATADVPPACEAEEAEGLRWVESKLSVQLSPAYLGDVRSGICEQLGGSMLR